MDLLDKVKERLDIKDISQDNKIQGYIDDITDKIKSVCNRIDLPKKLEYLVIRYAVNCYNYYKDNNSNARLQATSASDNGQTVNFKTVETVTKDDIDVDKYVDKNKDEISMYAYMRW